MSALAEADAPDRRSIAPARVARDVVLCVALAIAPYLWRVAMGTRRYPNDDAWAYERIFETFHLDGSISFVDWNDINLVGMFPVTELWVSVVGYGPLQVNLLGSVMGFVTLWAFRSILVTFGCLCIPFVVTTLGTAMGFVATTGTYMADQFALAGSVVSFALAASVAVRDDRAPAMLYALVVTSSVASIFAFTVRQQSVVAAGAVALLLLLAARHVRFGWLVFGAVYSVAIVPFYVWRSGLEHGGSTIVTVFVPEIGASVAVMVVMVSLALLPLVVASNGPLLHRWVALRLGASALFAAGVAAVDPTDRITDNLTIVWTMAGGSPATRAIAAIVATNVIITVIIGLFDARLPRASVVRVTALSAALVLAADLAVALVTSAYFARYSLFLLVLVLPVLSVATFDADRSIARRPVAGWIALVGVALTSAWTLDHDQAVAAADLAGARRAECAGVAHDEIDAGFVWMGANYDGIARARYFDAAPIEDGLPESWHHRIFPLAERQVLITSERPPADGEVVAVGRVERSGLLPGNHAERWIVVRSGDVERFEACLADDE